jgi:hypothetical protein
VPRILGLALLVLSLLEPSRSARAQGAPSSPPVATAAGLHAIASDGSRVRIGEITGHIEVTPATRASARFGRVHVRAGLDVVAEAGPDARVPIYATGALGGILEVAEDARDVRVEALHRAGREVVARLVIGDATFERIPVLLAQLRVEGTWREGSSVRWAEAPRAIREGTTRICVAPGRECTTVRLRAPLRVVGQERRGRWARVRADAEGIGLDGWAPVRALVDDPDAMEWAEGRAGALSDGCPYEGRPALVAARTPVSVRPRGPAWAHIPDDPESVWVHDTVPGSAWVELTRARGVELAYPGSTCSTGWVPRASVEPDRLRERGPDGTALELSRETQEEREVVVVRAAPAWLLDAGVALGDAIVARMERGQRHESADLDGMRAALGVGGTFHVLRGGAEREIRIPLAPGCEEPGAGQPVACRPR